jgi:hypothetical protein
MTGLEKHWSSMIVEPRRNTRQRSPKAMSFAGLIIVPTVQPVDAFAVA